MLFQMAQTQQQAEGKQETQENLTDAGTGSGQHPQTGSSPEVWLFLGVLGMAQPPRAGLDIQVALNNHRQVIFKPPR